MYRPAKFQIISPMNQPSARAASNASKAKKDTKNGSNLNNKVYEQQHIASNVFFKNHESKINYENSSRNN